MRESYNQRQRREAENRKRRATGLPEYDPSGFVEAFGNIAESVAGSYSSSSCDSPSSSSSDSGSCGGGD